MSDPLEVRIAPWPRDETRIRAVRGAVFTEEQGIDAALDFDGSDAGCVHAIALDDDGAAVGTGRITASGHVGRMAVMRPWRGHGVGSRLLLALVDAARERGLDLVHLNAQCTAIDFYARHGFTAAGDVFLDAGLEHVRMERAIAPERPGAAS